jgi:hypothetical protein
MLSLFPNFDLAPDVRRTFRFHLAYALLDAVGGGILLNMPVVALNAIHAPNWQFQLRDICVGFGMLASIYLGSWMAPRHKMPFVFRPGILACCCSLVMAVALMTGDSFSFFMIFGIGGMFEIVTRPAIAAILRQNYPVEHRGFLTATVRQWSSLVFMIALLCAAQILTLANKHVKLAASLETACAALLGLAGLLCFRQIMVRNEKANEIHPNFRLEIVKNVRETFSIVVRDARYRRFLSGCFLEGFFSQLYLPLVAVFLSKTLGYEYFGCALLLHGIPTLTAFAVTGTIGQWFDRANPWIAWAWVRFAFGIDAVLLALTPWVMLSLSSAPITLSSSVTVSLSSLAMMLPVLGRILRGGAQGGWWVLWWQIGITHFAPPGEDTSRYAGIMVFLNGLIRMIAAAAGMGLAILAILPMDFLWVGGLGVAASGGYSLWQAARERREHGPRTFTQFESQFYDCNENND